MWPWLIGLFSVMGLSLFLLPLLAGRSLVKVFSLSRGYTRKETLEHAYKRGHLAPGEDPLDRKIWEKFSFTAKDGVLLKGHWMKGSFEKMILLVHGHKSNSTGVLKYSKRLIEAGYGIVVYDTRSFGESGGKVCTGGFREKQDLLQLITMVRQRYPEASIGLWGESMGGATVLQSLKDSPPVDFAVAICPYTELKELFLHHLKRRNLKGFILQWSYHWAALFFKKIAGCAVENISAGESLKGNRIPLLLVHGLSDSYVPTQMSIDLHQHYPEHSELLLIEGGTHADSFVQNPSVFWQGTLDFLSRQKKAAPKGDQKKE